METLQLIISPLLLTLKIATISTFFVTVLGILIAYLLAKREFPGKRLADVLVTLPLVLPPTVTGYILVLLLGKNGIFGSIFFKNYREWDTLYLAGSSNCSLCRIFATDGKDRFTSP